MTKTEIFEAPDLAISNCILLGEAVDYFFAYFKATPLLLASPFIHKKCALKWKIPQTSVWEEKKPAGQNSKYFPIPGLI